MFTLLGLTALYLRWRNNSGQQEKDSNEDPSVISSHGQEVNDSKDQSQEEPTASSPQSDDDHSAIVLHRPTGDLGKSDSCCAVNNPQPSTSTVKDPPPAATGGLTADWIPKALRPAQQQESETINIGQEVNDSKDQSQEEPTASSIVLHRPTGDLGKSDPCCAVNNPQPSTSTVKDPPPAATGGLTADWIPKALRQQKSETINIVINSKSYKMGCTLGKGGFGSVVAATRVEDGLEVAIKLVSNEKAQFTSMAGHSQPIPMEIRLHILINQHPRVEEIIQLLDWEVKSKHHFMVLERPMPCLALSDFVKCNMGTMTEDMVRIIMHQATVVAQECCHRGVLHRDIKMANFLINPETLKVKLIDFGCGEPLVNKAYTSYCGTHFFCPPEYFKSFRYHGKPATVWSLGMLMFTMLFQKIPTKHQIRIINRGSQIVKGMSKESMHFLSCCLKVRPDRRTDLEKLSLLNWFKDINDVPQTSVCASSSSRDTLPLQYFRLQDKAPKSTDSSESSRVLPLLYHTIDSESSD